MVVALQAIGYTRNFGVFSKIEFSIIQRQLQCFQCFQYFSMVSMFETSLNFQSLSGKFNVFMFQILNFQWFQCFQSKQCDKHFNASSTDSTQST